MKLPLLILLGLAFFSQTARSVVITGFGSSPESGRSAFQIDTETTSFSTEQTSSATRIFGSESGNIFAGTFSAVDITGNEQIQLTALVTGANPNTNFTVELYNTNLDAIRTYRGNTEDFSSSNMTVTLVPQAGSASFTDIAGFQFTANGTTSSNLNMTFDTLSAVPEPSMYGLLMLGSMLAGGVYWKRRSL